MTEFKEIDRNEMKELLKLGSSEIIDIREIWEFKDFNIGGINVPAHELNEYKDIMEQFENLIIVCSNGTRSSIVARVLAKKLPNTTIYHLEEGIF
jgi:rhodanese-related sulfurtransferase